MVRPVGGDGAFVVSLGKARFLWGGHGDYVDTRRVTPDYGNLSVVENPLPIVLVALEELGESFPCVVSVFVGLEVVVVLCFEAKVDIFGCVDAVLPVGGKFWHVLESVVDVLGRDSD